MGDSLSQTIGKEKANIGIAMPMAKTVSIDAKTENEIADTSISAKDTSASIAMPLPEIGWQTFATNEAKPQTAKNRKKEITEIKIKGEEKATTITSEMWYTPMMVVAFLIYTIVFAARGKAIITEIATFFNSHIQGSIFGFEWMNNSRYKLALSALALLLLGASAYFLAVWGHSPHSRPEFFGICVGTAIGFVIAKIIILELLRYVLFPQLGFAPSNALMTVVRMCGICLIPFVLCAGYGPLAMTDWVCYYALAVLLISETLLIGKLVTNLYSGVVSIFYLALYILTFEALPIAGVVMVIKSIV